MSMQRRFLRFCCRRELRFALIMMLFIGSAQAQSYDTSLIPAEMRKDARTIKREERISIEIRENDKSTYRYFDAITVMDARAQSENVFYEYTNKFTELESLEIELFDAKGKPQGRYSKKDMVSQAAGSGLVEEGKLYYLKITPLSYPVTIQTEKVIRKKGFLQLPSYEISQPGQSVIHSSYSVKYPASMQLNAKAYHMDISPVKGRSGDDQTAKWEVHMRPAKSYEASSGPWSANAPHVLFNTNHFNYDGYEGSMASWQAFGEWYNGLVTGINKLLPEEQEEVRKIVQGAQSDRDKIKILYRYLQQNFRYVSIQLGIGGFRPFPASFVHQKKYGDCKALSNYMEACLDAVGIKSYSAWINAGEDQPAADPDFSYDPFNHQILCVPLSRQDTIWLECTSSMNDFGHLGNFTENRNALLLTERGGVLVRTPKSKASENTLVSTSMVTIDATGSGQQRTLLQSTGEFKYNQVSLGLLPENEIKTHLVNYQEFSQADQWKMRFGDKKQTPFQSEFELNLEKVPDIQAGSKMFLRPRMYSLYRIDLPKAEKRTTDFILSTPFERLDTTSYLLPDGYRADPLPEGVSLESPFGVFKTSYWISPDQKTLYTSAFFRVSLMRVPADQFPAFRAFLQKVKDEAGKRLIIKPLSQ